MNEFKIELYDGHAIVKSDENLILLDTGVSSTIHVSDNLHFCSENYKTSSNYMGLTVQKVSEMLGAEITTLLGTDIISKYKMLLDYKNESVAFSKTPIDMTGNAKPLSIFMGAPIIDLEIDGEPLKFFLDTGAKLSYLSKNYTREHQSAGTEEDFYPGVGKFQTNRYEILTKLDNHQFVVGYGNLPSLFHALLTMSGTDGIIGYDFFMNFRILLNLENNTLSYEKS